MEKVWDVNGFDGKNRDLCFFDKRSARGVFVKMYFRGGVLMIFWFFWTRKLGRKDVNR
ncbi:MAG: hypothetical protein ACJA02_000784 [Myxococcota bacterium]|jgi:hypothetical protein